MQWSDGSNSVWAAAGGGWGTAANVRETGRAGTGDLDLRLGLVEVRRELSPLGGVAFGVRADAAWAQLRTGAGEETVDGQTAPVNQLRVGAEVSRPARWENGSLSPFGEVHVRRDAGAGQTGTGLEVVAGARLAQGWLRVDAQGRLLVLHSASGYRERGVGVTVGVGSREREGLSLSVSPRWGDAAAGGGALWQEQVWRRYLPQAVSDEWALDARGEYGTRLRSGRLLTWFGSLSRSAYGRRLLAGGRVGGGGRPPQEVKAAARADVPAAGQAAGAGRSGRARRERPQPARWERGTPDRSAPDAPALPADAAGPAPRPRTVAVARFVNRSGAPADAWVGRGIAESVAAGLDQLGAVRVIRAGAAATPAERVRPAGWRIGGEYERAGGRLRIVGTLTDTRTGAVVASAAEEGVWDDLFVLQDRITDALAAALDAQP